MRISDATDLGALIRSRRHERALTQIQLAALARVSRRWLSDVEAGKDSAELGMVLRTLRALDLSIDVQAARNPVIDLDAVLARHRGPQT